MLEPVPEYSVEIRDQHQRIEVVTTIQKIANVTILREKSAQNRSVYRVAKQMQSLRTRSETYFVQRPALSDSMLAIKAFNLICNHEIESLGNGMRTALTLVG